MNKKCTTPTVRLLSFLSLFLFAGCFRQSTDPVWSGWDRYSISIPVDLTLPITITYTTHEGNRFILPYHYYDNPVDSFNGPLVVNCTATDCDGNAVAITTENELIGPIENRIVVIPETVTYPVTFTYQLDLSVLSRDTADKDMPHIFQNESSFYLQGAYCFMIPEISTNITTLWRTSYTTELNIIHEAGTTIYGIPHDTVLCDNIYELLFLQLSSTKRIVTRGYGGGVDFIVTDFCNKSYSPTLCDSVQGLIVTILNEVANNYGLFSFMTEPQLPYTITLHPLWGALEGTYGFASREPGEGTDERFGEILTHEILHHYIGIRCGDYDDPWWKEAAATYLGLETSVKLGLYSKEAFRQRITTRFFGADSTRFQRALSDPWLRSHMFVENMHMLVYDRGSQVMMLLDVRTRTGSRNQFTLNNVIADLCRRYSGSAFRRNDFIATLSAYGAGNTEDIFATYVDRPDSVLSTEQLTAIFTTLDSVATW